ncbi:MAG: arginine decarboxylase, partial [Alphaproteobacteria bacterium]|nr:arginine decarboxylase [Alphaproteobacteria bacterium]
MKQIHSVDTKILLVYDCEYDKSAVCRAVQALSDTLADNDVMVIQSDYAQDAHALIVSDPSISCLLINYKEDEDEYPERIRTILTDLRTRNPKLPVFLMANRLAASNVPTDILDKVNDFIWILEDTTDFIAGRILNAAQNYQSYILPPMFKSLVNFANVHEYSWHTPGHTGGTAFLKSPAGRAFFDFFGERLFRSDLSISVGELGSLLDHSGPIGESELYMAKVFGAERSYHVTNGTSTSNRVVLMASLTRNQVALCDRNCHKSVEHAMTMSGAVPTYLVPTRNGYGIIGPIPAERLTDKAVKKAIKNNPLVHDGIDPTPVHATITNSTYDGLCYNVRRVTELLGNTVDRLHFDEAWYGYARFNPLYKDRFAMYGEAKEYDKNGPTVFATQSTHKLLAALSQASMIHMRNGRRPISHARFNEAFMMHASTSPFYPIIASNDVTVAMMDQGGQALTTDAIAEAVSFRQTMGRLNREFAAKHDWFFNVWQPDTVTDEKTGKMVPFFSADPKMLTTNPDCWMLEP